MTSKLQEVSQWIKENQLKSIGKRSFACARRVVANPSPPNWLFGWNLKGFRRILSWRLLL